MLVPPFVITQQMISEIKNKALTTSSGKLKMP